MNIKTHKLTNIYELFQKKNREMKFHMYLLRKIPFQKTTMKQKSCKLILQTNILI